MYGFGECVIGHIMKQAHKMCEMEIVFFNIVVKSEENGPFQHKIRSNVLRYHFLNSLQDKNICMQSQCVDQDEYNATYKHSRSSASRTVAFTGG